MNRRGFLRISVSGAALLEAGASASAHAADLVFKTDQVAESRRRIDLATAAALSMERRDWEQGIFAQAMLEAGNRDAVIRLTRAAMVQQTADGRMGVVVSGGPTDPAMGGEAYAQAAAWTADPEIRQAVEEMLDWILHRAPRAHNGTLYHVFDHPEMWSDGVNCAPPFLAAMGYYDEALAQIEGYRTRLWNPKTQLWSHIWDERAQRLTEAAFWGGGNGWAAAGLTRVIRLLPPQRSADRNRLTGYLRETIDGCLAHQRPDGLFHNVIDQPDSFVETNLAQMLAFSLFTGLHEGWLDVDFRELAIRMRFAARAKMDALGFVHGVCGAPNFDRPGLSAEGQSFCIMMEAAAQRLAPI